MIYTVKEVSKILKINTQTAYRLIREGELPHTKVGNSIRIHKAQLEHYLQERSK